MKVLLLDSLRLVFIAALVVALWAITRLVCGGEMPEPARVFDSPRHEVLMQLAQAHAEHMARVQVQGHQGFDCRYRAAIEATGCRRVAEICAETWPEQCNASADAIWGEYVNSWRQSPGHWSVARARHRLVGAGTARGTNGVWYGCVIVAD